MRKDIVVRGTPWETYTINGRKVHVKREDLCCPSPGPGFSKIRGIEKVIREGRGAILPPTRYGVVDSVHSKAGWGVSYICDKMKIPCTVFYPKLKAEDEGYLRPFQKRCQEFGSELIPLPATKSSVLFYQARKIFRERYPEGFLFPNGLKLEQTIHQTALEVCEFTPPEFLVEEAVWVISVSSGTIAAGVARGLNELKFKGKLVLHMGFSRSKMELFNYIQENLLPPGRINLDIIDEGYEYKDAVDFRVPFPCNPYYDRKAWKWLNEGFNAGPSYLKFPVVFWNIGG